MKKHDEDKRLGEYQLYCRGEFSAIQLPIETIIAPVGKSAFAIDLQAYNIFGGNGAAKIKKNSFSISNISGYRFRCFKSKGK